MDMDEKNLIYLWTRVWTVSVIWFKWMGLLGLGGGMCSTECLVTAIIIAGIIGTIRIIIILFIVITNIIIITTACVTVL